MEFINNIKLAFASEQIKIKNKQLMLISLLSPLLSLFLIFIITEFDSGFSDFLQNQTIINDLLYFQLVIYVGIVQPFYIVLICHIVFKQIESQKGISILQNSVLPHYFIDYSKILLIIKYNFYNILFLLGYLLSAALISFISSGIEFSINYETLPNFLFIIFLFPLLTLPVITLLNIISKWKSSFYISFLLVLPLVYFVNFQAMMIFKTTIYSYFDIQLVLIQTIGSDFPISSHELLWVVSSNVIVVTLFLFIIKRYPNSRIN
ncbi:MAG: hypothetical protein CVV25_05445 [Ignavibacteriae bacterium HGW-Ignavibacteriae-4]|jgi:hypothetical protein|nr:MAG: hypothetical protein CVV25_05445 [Ignavibacteriae bacterium HGW-Ignavibacteriae-4]